MKIIPYIFKYEKIKHLDDYAFIFSERPNQMQSGQKTVLITLDRIVLMLIRPFQV